MKKMFFYLPLAALALAACSSDEVVNNAQQIAAVNGDQLQIAPVVQGNTRATAVTTSNLASFKVRITGNFQDGSGEETAAEPIASGSEVVVTKSGGSWTTASEYWWADKTTEATFTAWSPADQTTAVTVENAIADQKDIIVAYNNGKREDFDAGVPLNFQHVMSQIIVKALNKDASANFTVKVGGIKIMHAKNKGTLTYPTASTAAGTFSWDSYDPWGNTANGSDNYINGSDKATTANVTSPLTLTASANNLADPMMLMPQTLASSDLTQESLSGNYLAILVKVTGASVAYRDADGYYYTAGESGVKGEKINFTSKRTGSTENDTYSSDEITAINKVAAGEAGASLPETLKTGSGESETTATSIYTEVETIYPKQGYATSTDNYAYVGVDLGGLTWEPGKKYVYTLNFSKDGIGKSIADQPSDKPTTGNFPYGNDFETGGGNGPGEDIIDNPTQLFFTVTVDEWIDADAQNKDM